MGTNLLKQRFQDLIEQARKIEANTRVVHDSYSGSPKEQIDYDALLNWKVKAKALIVNVCGENSQHFKQFEKYESSSMSSLTNLRHMMAIFEGAREDFQGGYLISIHDLIQADVFESQLEQASELLRSKYPVAAAVIAGVVLETTIRGLCTRNQIQNGTLDRMNADPAKAGVYNSIMQKRVTHLAAVRNSAAHGNETEFRTYDVKAMIDEVEQFLAAHLSST